MVTPVSLGCRRCCAGAMCRRRWRRARRWLCARTAPCGRPSALGCVRPMFHWLADCLCCCRWGGPVYGAARAALLCRELMTKERQPLCAQYKWLPPLPAPTSSKTCSELDLVTPCYCQPAAAVSQPRGRNIVARACSWLSTAPPVPLSLQVAVLQETGLDSCQAGAGVPQQLNLVLRHAWQVMVANPPVLMAMHARPSPVQPVHW